MSFPFLRHCFGADDGFASGTSLVYVQDWPKADIRKASEAYEKLTRLKLDS
jgi:hypothetical protein